MPARPDARRRVAVGVDGSDESRAAIAYALAAAARRGVGLDVVGVYSLQMYYVGGGALAVPDVAAIRDGFEQLVTRTVEEVRADPRVAAVPGVAEVDVRVLVATGPAAQVLVDHGTDVGLLVVGSRGRGAVRSALLGSVALHCATHASCPVVVVHPGSEEHPARRVVVGVDGSDTARAALVAGLDEAARTGADQQGDVDVLEGDQRVGGGDHAGQQRERAVFQLHHHALQRGLGLLIVQLEQLQDDRLVLAQHFAGSDAEQQGVADLASGAASFSSAATSIQPLPKAISSGQQTCRPWRVWMVSMKLEASSSDWWVPVSSQA